MTLSNSLTKPNKASMIHLALNQGLPVSEVLLTLLMSRKDKSNLALLKSQSNN
jgi:hypothetical protein